MRSADFHPGIPHRIGGNLGHYLGRLHLRFVSVAKRRSAASGKVGRSAGIRRPRWRAYPGGRVARPVPARRR